MNKIKFSCLFPCAFLYILLISASAFAGNYINWHDYEKGIKLGKTNQKKVFLYFYSDSCRYCGEMQNKTFKDKSVIDSINNNFIPVKVNTDNERYITGEYRVRGLPSVYFISEKGEIIKKHPGFIPPDVLLLFTKYIYTDSYKTMSAKAFSDTQKASEK